MVLTDEGRIELRGTGEGLVIRVHISGNISPVKHLIKQKIEENPDFYKKATLAELTCEYLLPEDHDALQQWLYEEYQMHPPIKKSTKKSTETNAPEAPSKPEPISWNDWEKEKSDDTKFIQGTVRSGQKINSIGNIIVLGDVNPGAELVAGGNIVVMGSFRGIAHAGFRGNAEAFVAALALQPTQLRIHQTITRAPDEELEMSKTPEIARLRDNAICIEPFFIKNQV